MNLGRSEEAWSIVVDDMPALLLRCPSSLVLLRTLTLAVQTFCAPTQSAPLHLRADC